MPSPRVLILRAPGTNCDGETAFAFDRAGGRADIVHVNRLLENPRLAREYQILCIPGGFSFGDDIAAGRILAVQIQHHLADSLAEFKAAGKLILGICNGFQVLIKSRILLDDAQQAGPPATLTWNDSGKFEDRWVNLAAKGNKCVFLKNVESLYLPVAHAEGKFVAHSARTLEHLEQSGQLVLRYCAESGDCDYQVPYPANPNGSMANVAGVCDETGHVFGLMPHPERHVDPTNHPRWTRLERKEKGDGLVVFENAVGYFGD